jgi:hypothetical protein
MRLVGGVCACAGGGTGLGSATLCAVRARRRAAAVGSWLVVCAASTRPLSDFLFCWAMRAISRGRACLLRGGGMRRGMGLCCCEDARVRVGQCGAGGVG